MRKEPKPIDLDKYRGEWLALSSGRIVAHGRRLDEVAKKAEKIDPEPVFHKVSLHDVLVV